MSDGGAAKLFEQRDEDAAATMSETAESQRALCAPSLLRLGRYRLVREIASGGMASVSLAVAEGLDKLVALKMIHPHLANDHEFVDMFLDEARIASSISHRNVCSTFDFGEEGGRFFLAMEYLAGQSLRDVIRRLKPARPPDSGARRAALAAYLLSEAAEGLHAAHEVRGSDGRSLEIVHRDVSPHNLFVTYDGNVSVVDFGIARAADRLQHTATGVLKGKFSYMAPEQVRQLSVDRRADVWSLGVCLWEMLTQKRLFARPSQADTLMAVLMDDPVPPPSSLDPSLPLELDAIVLKALSRKTDARYATARELGRDLVAFLRACPEPMGAVEVEQRMNELFEPELGASRRLIQVAKQTVAEEHGGLSSTASLLARSPTRSGPMPKMAKAALEPSELRLVAVESSLLPPADNTQSLTTVRTPRLRFSLGLALVAGIALALLVERALPRPADPSALGVPGSPALPGSVQRSRAIVAGASTAAPASAARLPAAPSSEASPSLPEGAGPPGSGASKAPPSGVGDEDTPSRAAREDDLAPLAVARLAPVARRASLRARRPIERTALASRAGAVEPPRTRSSATRSVPSTEASESSPPPIEEPAAASPSERASTANADQTPPSQPSSAGKLHEVTATATSMRALREAGHIPVAPPAAAEVTMAPVSFEARAGVARLEVDGSLGSGVVRRALERVEPLLSRCYEDAARRSRHNRYVAVSVSLTLDEMGASRDAQAGSHPLSGLSACVADALKRVRSERKPDVGTVRVRFDINYRAP